MNTIDIQVASFVKRLVDPFIILCIWYVLVLVHGQAFTGYDLVMMIITFFIYTRVYEELDPYCNWSRGRILAHARDVFVGWAVVVAFLIVIGHATGLAYGYQTRTVLLWFGVTPFALLTGHVAVRILSKNVLRKRAARSIAIVGTNEMSIRFAEWVKGQPNLLIDLRGYFDDRSCCRQLGLPAVPRLGACRDVGEYVREKNIKAVLISLPMAAQPRIQKLVDDLQDTTASVYFLPDIQNFDVMQAGVDQIAGIPVVAVCETPFRGMNGVIKRAVDLCISLGALMILSPVMVAVALAVKSTSSGPIIFKQRRYGLDGESIMVYKFRSMTVCEDGAQVVQARKNDQRVTMVGAFLRRSSLDELPQLINVLQGRMSIVGPRPHAVAHNEMYRKLIKGYMLRHKAKPGITGWAQVNGLRGETDTLDKMRARIDHDLHYLRNWSIFLDLRIILRTIQVVIRRDNAY